MPYVITTEFKSSLTQYCSDRRLRLLLGKVGDFLEMLDEKEVRILMALCAIALIPPRSSLIIEYEGFYQDTLPSVVVDWLYTVEDMSKANIEGLLNGLSVMTRYTRYARPIPEDQFEKCFGLIADIYQERPGEDRDRLLAELANASNYYGKGKPIWRYRTGEIREVHEYYQYLAQKYRTEVAKIGVKIPFQPLGV